MAATQHLHCYSHPCLATPHTLLQSPLLGHSTHIVQRANKARDTEMHSARRCSVPKIEQYANSQPFSLEFACKQKRRKSQSQFPLMSFCITSVVFTVSWPCFLQPPVGFWNQKQNVVQIKITSLSIFLTRIALEDNIHINMPLCLDALERPNSFVTQKFCTFKIIWCCIRY